MKVEAIAHVDVRGNTLKYVRLTSTDGQKTVLINVGEKTFTAVAELLTPTKTETKTNGTEKPKK